MHWQDYVLLIFSIFLVFFVISGGDIVNTLRIFPLFFELPPIILIPLIILFVILTFFAYTDFKRNR